MKNPLKDETQELIDQYANAADERQRLSDEKKKNATIELQKKKELLRIAKE